MDQYLEHDKNQKQYLITLSAWLVTTVLSHSQHSLAQLFALLSQ